MISYNTKLQNEQNITSRIQIDQLLFEVSLFIVVIFLSVFVIPKYILQRTVVIGDSMEPSLSSNDNIWVEKVSCYFDSLKRYDVIVFYPFGKGKEDYYIKRIIGLPGETVQIIGSVIYINGIPLRENFGKEPIHYQGIAADPIQLDQDEYFVLGDNREVSFDSRYEKVGPVKRKNIGGRAIVRVWPLSKAIFL